MKKVLLIVLLFTVSIYCYAQTPDIKFDHIGIKDGLPEQQVNAIHQDVEGYLWMGTQNGLVRYDGYNYKVYRLGSLSRNKTQNTDIVTIFENDDKVLWVSTIFNGLFYYDRSHDVFQQIDYPKQISYYKITAEDNDHNIWGISSDLNIQGIARYNIISKTFEVFNKNIKGINHLNATIFYEVYKTKSDGLWVASGNGLYHYKGNGKGFEGYFTTNDTSKTELFNPIYEAPSEPGILWANTFHGSNQNLKLSRFDCRSHTLKNYFPGNGPGELNNAEINSIYEDKKKQLWIGIASGIAKMDRKTGQFTNFLKKDTAKNVFSNFVETPRGNFWLTSTLGLVYFNVTSGEFKLYSGQDAPTSIYGKIMDNTGQLWVGSVNAYKTNYLKSAFHVLKSIPGKTNGFAGGTYVTPAGNGNYWVFAASDLYLWKPATQEFTKILKTNITYQNFNTLCMGNDGLVYFSTNEGLKVYNLKTQKEEILSIADTSFIRTVNLNIVYRDRTGLIWLGTYQHGICSYDPKTKKITRYPYRHEYSLGVDKEDGKLDDYTVLNIYEDRENTLWIGTNNGGLNKFDRSTGKFYSYHTVKNQNMFCVISMHDDASGHLWVGTYLNGLFEFDKKTGAIIRNINENSGLIHNQVMSINEDTTGNLVILTQRGITRLNPATGSIQNFNVNTILPGEDIGNNLTEDNLTENSRLTTNSVAFSLKDGIVEYNPQALAANTTLPIVHITGITYSDPLSGASAKSIIPYEINKLELPHNENRIQFDYIGLHFDNPSQNQYAYKLDGYDKNWVNAAALRTVTYTNLSPGTYTFHVRASNADGVWNNTGASITIIIHTSLWMRWWAWLIYIVLFAAAIYGFIAYRSRALKHENQILEEKINDRTQQLTNANKSLSEQQEEIITQRDRLAETVTELKTTQQQLVQSEKLASLGELTAGIAHEIQNPLNFVNNFSEVSVELIDEMQEELRNGDKDEAIEISESIKQNLEKIRHHGKRADGIVKKHAAALTQ